MRYRIDYNKTINQLVPHYIGGRKLILFLQSLMKPLQELNDLFVNWAKETRIEAAMTSQVFKFEWFLNRRFNKYFLNPQDLIYITDRVTLGTPFYSEDNSAIGIQHPILYSEDENGETMILRLSTEKNIASTTSFTVHVPEVDQTKITKKEYLSMIKYQIDKYRLSGKTYSIIYNETL